MNNFTKKGIVQKIIIALVIVLLFQFCIPPKVHAGIVIDTVDSVVEALKDFFADLGKKMLVGSARLVAVIGDIVMSALNNWMLRNSGIWYSNDIAGRIRKGIMV